MIEQLETDYLIIGAGAVAMAFADEIVSQSKTARIIMVDRRATPGGHWNNAYSFVSLHQPSLYYGVNSERLEKSPEHHASADEIVAYYARVMNKMCGTGRVQFFGECEYRGEGRFESLNGERQEYHVTVHRRTVDAADSRVTVPSTRPPQYAVAESMHSVPINALASLDREWSRYMVIGTGKTGIDAVLRLLDIGTDPDRITWIVSNDVWMINREFMMPEAFARVINTQLRETCLATDVNDYFRRFEAKGWFMRLDPSVPVTRFHCATVDPQELEALRRIQDVVRLGRVNRIDTTEVVLDRGTIPTSTDVLHVDCTADGLTRRPARPVFDGDNIILQPVTLCQPTMNAAMIANIEMLNTSDARKNRMSSPSPNPKVPSDYFVTVLAMGHNLIAWTPMRTLWLMRKRLSVFSHLSLWSKIRLTAGMLRWFFGAMRKAEEFIRACEEADQET